MQYIVVGGEDDLVTVYSMAEKRVVLRGQGHKSWVAVVAFDEYNLSYGDLPDGLDFSGSDEEGVNGDDGHSNSANSDKPSFSQTGSVRRQSSRKRVGPEVNGSTPTNSQHQSHSSELVDTMPAGASNSNVTCYRFGSVGQDTLICLWDITEEALTRATREGPGLMSPLNSGGFGKIHPNSSHLSNFSSKANASNSATAQYIQNSSTQGGGSGNANNHVKMSNSNSVTSKDSGIITDTGGNGGSSTSSAATSASAVSSSGGGMSLTHRLASFTLGGDKHRGDKEERSSGRGLRGNFSLGRSSKDRDQGHNDKHGGSSSSLLSSSKSVNSNYQNNSLSHGNASGQQRLSEGGLENGDCVRLGSIQCPRIHDVPIIEPLVMKKIAHERLTALVFREECLVTACQDGYVCTWARPGRVVS